jgi:hypothetical protein
LRNLELRVPRLSSPDFYRLSTDYVEFDGSRVEVEASIGDGSVTLFVELPLGDGAAF